MAASWARASKVKDEVNCTSFNCSGSEVSYEGDIDGEVQPLSTGSCLESEAAICADVPRA